MGRKLLTIVCLASLLFITALLILPEQSEALPAFARVYGVDCNMCHTNVPQLNRTGYEFRSAGFRMPNEIGKDLPTKGYNITNYLVMMAVMEFQFNDHADTSAGGGSTASSDTLGFEATEFDLFPMIGAWGKNFGSEVQLGFSLTNGGRTQVSLSNAFVKGVWGDEDGWFGVKLGTLSNDEYSNRFVTGLTGEQGTPLSTLNSVFGYNDFSEAGIELNYSFTKMGTDLALRVAESPGYGQNGAKGGLTQFNGFYAQYGDGYSGVNRPSFQLSVNQFIGGDSAISVFWYNGLINNLEATTVASNVVNDTINRVSVYANYYVVPSTVNIIAGLLYGYDSLSNPGYTAANGVNGITLGNASSVSSLTVYAGLEYKLSDHDAFSASWGYQKPTDLTAYDHTNVSQIALGHNHRFATFGFLKTNLTSTSTEVQGGGTVVDNTLSSTLVLVM